MLAAPPTQAASLPVYLPMGTKDITRFGRYEIVGELGRGAMGVVYKARDPQIDRLVALKTVSLQRHEPEQDEEFRQRFIYEAQAAGRLHHPGIVAIFDAGEDPDSHNPYIVLEYVSGESLSRILSREKKLPLADALRLAEEIAGALDYAHAQGVVHRDIKPANILITDDGHAKIADLGIAKLNLAYHTLPGCVLGTPAFMAPEQLSGEGVDGRADLFSLGVLLYSMVTGHSPFHGNSATTVCFKVVHREPVPVSALDLELPRSLDAVISHAIAKDPNARYQRGSDFAADLRLLQQPGSTTTSLIASSRSRTGSAKALSATASSGLAARKQPASSALRQSPARLLIVGAALVLLFAVLDGNPVQRLAASRKTVEARAGSAASPTQRGDENTAAAQLPPTGAIPVAPSVPPIANFANVPAEKFATNSAPHAGFIKTSSRSLNSSAASGATLELAVQHQFKEATLSLWIDNKLMLTHPLHGTARKHMIVFNGVQGSNSETVQVPAGDHVIRLRAQSTDQSVDLSRTISVALTRGDNRTLQVTFNNHNTAMNLVWR